MFGEELHGERGLPTLTTCRFGPGPDASLNRRKLAYVLVGAIVLCTLGISHVSLRFAMREVSQQHRILQDEMRELVQQVGRLELENESLCSPDRLKAIGVETLGMREASPGSREALPFPRSMARKYLAPTPTPRRDPAAERADAPRVSTTQRMVTILDSVDRAVAGSPAR